MAEQEQKMGEAIAFFEQMLQTMPDDRTSLEFLSVAYEQTGQTEKRRECLIRLADTLLREKDYDNAQVIAGYLSAFTDDPGARAAVERVAELVQGQILKSEFRREVDGLAGAVSGAATEAPGGGLPAFQETGVEVHALSRSASAAEMDLVWLWKENEFLPKEMCMDVLHVLTERPVTDTPVLISALALLDEQHPEVTERVMESMQRLSEVPPLPLELFEPQPEAVALLPQVFVHVKGVLPFALFGGEVLVAVLNPLNRDLQAEVSARIGKPCHFYLAHPQIWQHVFSKIAPPAA
ncbi:MAG: hypothetical protein RBT78_00950 [Kiritimatiellia bacterium]|jgi:hypothetical protein|nr:hypothetical protein [Kiritimatiellia bacterium]